MKMKLMLNGGGIYIVVLTLFSILQSSMLQAQSCDPCAESSLSNLTATAIDVSLLPASDATVDIGGSSGNFDWADIYLQKVIHFDIGADFNNEDVLELNGNSFLHVTGGSYDGLFLGEYAGDAATSSNHGMVGIGHKALETITGSAGHNTSVGWYSSSLMTSGGKNTLMGSRAGQNITTGSSNTGVGHNVFYRSGMDITYISGTGNVGIGATSDNTGVLGNLTSGYKNTVAGYDAAKVLNTGYENTIVGYIAGADLTSGNQNIFIGSGASSGDNGTTVGTGNIIIGINEDLYSSTASNRMNIGGVLYADLSANKVSINNSGSTLSNTFNVGPADEFQVDNTGVIKEYKGLATDGLGVPVILNVLTLSDQSSSITNGMLLEDAPAGVYRNTYQGIVTVAADVASALSFKVRYTDADITSGTVDVPSTNITGNNSTTSNTVGSANFSGVVIIQVADITDIKYIVSRASENTESMEYSLRVILERIQ